MKYAIYYFLLIILLVALPFCGNIIDGNCEYIDHSGYIKINGFGDTVNTKIKILFNFYKNSSDSLKDAFYIDSNCISNLKIQIGNCFNCIRSDIVKGACEPFIYNFDSAKCLNNYNYQN
jgi:hypothetical protein